MTAPRYSVVGVTEHFNKSLEVLEAYLPGKGAIQRKRNKSVENSSPHLVKISEKVFLSFSRGSQTPSVEFTKLFFIL